MAANPSSLTASQSASDTSIYEVHITPSCALGFGYNPARADCTSGVALSEDVNYCTDASLLSELCVTKSYGSQTSYIQKTTTASETKELLKTMVTVEGSGWGAKASASVNYMVQSTQTENSVSFYVGQNGATIITAYQAPSKLSLKAAARQTLEEDWQQFIDVYGTHFVSEVTYSSTFLGQVSVTQIASDSKSSLEAVASFEADQISGVFSTKGSLELETEVQNSASSLKMIVSKWWNGQVLPIADDGVDKPAVTLWKDYQSWLQNVLNDPEANSTPTKMVYRSWLTLEEVQSVLMPIWDDKVAKAFAAELPTQQTLMDITEEYLWSKAQLNTVKTLAGYPCVKQTDNSAVVNLIIDALTAHVTDIEALSMDEILDIQDQVRDNDSSFFISRSDKFISSLDKMTQACEAPALVKAIDFTYQNSLCPIRADTIQPDSTIDDTPTVNINAGRNMNDYDYVCLTYTSTTEADEAASDLKELKWSYGELLAKQDELGWTDGVPQWSQIRRGYFTDDNKDVLGSPYAITEQDKTYNVDTLFSLMDMHTEDAEKLIRADSLVLFRSMSSVDPALPSNIQPLLSSLDVVLFDDVTSEKDSYVKEVDGSFLDADLNEDDGGDYAYLDRKTTLDTSAALTDIKVVISETPLNGLGVNYGNSDYRYIVATRESGGKPIVADSVVLYGTSSSTTTFKANYGHCTMDLNMGRHHRYLYICYDFDDEDRFRDHCTGDLNDGRKGEYIHVCYNYWTRGSVNPDADLPTECSIMSNGRRRAMLPAPGQATAPSFDGSALIQRLLRNGLPGRRRAIPELMCEGESDCYFGFPGFTDNGYPHIHAGRAFGVKVTFAIPRSMDNAIRNPSAVRVINNDYTLNYNWMDHLEDHIYGDHGYENRNLCDNGEVDCDWDLFFDEDVSAFFENRGGMFTDNQANGGDYRGESGDGDAAVQWKWVDDSTRFGHVAKFGSPADDDTYDEMIEEIERVIEWFRNVWPGCAAF